MGFKKLKDVLPRTQNSALLDDNEIEHTFAKLTARSSMSEGRKENHHYMSFANFAKIFEVVLTPEQIKQNMMPYITLKSFVEMPQLELQPSLEQLYDKDASSQADLSRRFKTLK